MRFRAALGPWLALVLAAAPAVAAESLENLLARMDQAAASFRSMTADVRRVEHTAVINDDTVDTGNMWLKRAKHDIRMRVEFLQPDRKSVAMHESKVEIYYPKQHTVDEYDIGNHRELLDVFLLVGFGTSGKDLDAAYSMRVAGDEETAGQKTTRLELVPKSAEVLHNLKKLELWISATDTYPVQQKFYLSAGDYQLVTYTNVKMNPPLSDSDLKLKLPRDVKRVFPQK